MAATRSIAALAVALTMLIAGTAQAATITVACSALGIGQRLCREGAEAWAAGSGNAVRFVAMPKAAGDQLALYQQLLAAGSGDIDVLQIDVVWPGLLAGYLADLSGRVPPDTLDGHLKPLAENATVKGRLVALPWFTDVGLLYHRADLLARYGRAVPNSWAELEDTARLVQEGERAAGRDRMWGYVWQGRAYEGLTVNALEWVDSFGGGFIAPDGRITVTEPPVVDAVAMAAGWVGTISPVGVLNYTEEEARGVFQSGNAVFMRNWPYAWPLANAADSPVRGAVGVSPLPAGPGGTPSGGLGGQMLAVNDHSPNRDAAADLVLALTGPAEQTRRAIAGGYNPTIRALYDDPEILATQPFVAEVRRAVDSAVARPARATGLRYTQASAAIRDAVHAALSGRQPAAEAMSDLDRTLWRISRGGRW